MRLLLDECVPRKLKNSLAGHDCQTVPEAGFAGKKNGELLQLAEAAGFDVFITLDKGLEYQQNLRSLKLLIILLRSKSGRLGDLLPLVPFILESLDSLHKGEMKRIGG